MTTVEPSAASAMMSQGDWTRITMYPTCSSAAAKGSPGKEGQWRYSRGPGPPVPHLRSVWTGRSRQGRSCGRRRLRGCGPPGRRAGSFPRRGTHQVQQNHPASPWERPDRLIPLVWGRCYIRPLQPLSYGHGRTVAGWILFLGWTDRRQGRTGRLRPVDRPPTTRRTR